MNTPTQILSAEHQNILKVAGMLKKEAESLAAGKALDKDFFVKVIGFIKNYADKFHHAKEEEILFVELSKNPEQMAYQPVEQMLWEHELGRSFVKNMEQGLVESDSKKLADNARDYAQMISEHIFKEDNILYPMADEALSAETQGLMLEKFKQVEVKFGEEMKSWLAVVAELENRN